MATSRRLFLLGLLAAAAPQQLYGKGLMVRVAVVLDGSRESHRTSYEAFLEGMAALGYLNGRNLMLEARWLEGRLERLPAVIAELLELPVDVIVVAGSQAVRAARRATLRVPIVMAAAGDPVAQGFIASLPRPGGNVTGIAIASEIMVSRMFEILHEVLPNAKRIAALTNPSNAVHGIALKQAHSEAAMRRLTLLPYEASSLGELERALAAILEQRPEALVVGADALFASFRGRIARFALANRVPSAWFFSEALSEGGLMSFSASMTDNYYRAARYVHRILKGARPQDLPVEQHDGFELTINVRTAKALGIRIPQSVIASADELID